MASMTIEEICKIREDIDKVVDAHPDELKETLATALQDCGDLGDADEIRKQYDEKVAPGRQLHIGIVGRVKAGKSSMLNSLFFGGKNVLPKAATPMTAALTKLRYSEKPVVKINFIDANDKAKIEQKAAEYKRLFNSKVEGMLKDKRERAELKKQPFDEAEQRKKCEKRARSDLSENNVILAGAAEQAEMLQKASSSVLQMLGKSVEKELDRIEDVAKELAGYVGADGAYTPITRDVELGFPFDALKDITVVDTPGFDDPVPSRDAAARDSLKKCDAIFILSPAGQFCNEEDRTNMEKIESGEGIQNISVVASKIDGELGNEDKDEAAGDIQKELTLIVKRISKTLRDLAEGFPKDGILHKKLTEDLGRGLLYTSGICQSMYETWENKSSWDSDSTDTWERLKETYPNHFSGEDDSARETLKTIGNIRNIRERIAEVRGKKDEILSSREEEFLSAKGDMVKKVAVVLKDSFAETMRAFQSADLDTLKKEKEKQEENFAVLKGDFEEALGEVFEDYVAKCRETCNKIVKDFFEGTRETADNANETKEEERIGTREVKYEVKVKDSGFGGKWNRFWGAMFHDTDSGYHNETRSRDVEYTYTESCNYVDARKVRRAITDFAENMKDELQGQVDERRRLLRVNLKSIILNIWARYQMSEFIGEKARGNQAGNIVSAIPDCDISISWSLPSRLRSGGRLKNDDADEYMDAALEEMRNIKSEYNDSIKSFLSSVKSKLDAAKTADMILAKMRGNLDKMMKSLDEREATLDNYRHIQAEIEEFVSRLA